MEKIATVMNDSQKGSVKCILRAVIFLLFLSLGAAGIYNVIRWKDTSAPYFSSMDQMYDLPAEIIDVAFFGPSTMFSGANPAVFWEESGIASFNAAISGQDREAAYYYIKEFTKRQSPKVVVVAGMLFQIDHYEVQGNIYRNTLSMHNSGNFVDVVNAVAPANDKTGTNTVWDYYLRWPIIHSRYKEIEKRDFVADHAYENNLGYTYGYEGNGYEPNPVYFNSEIISEISDENREWVNRLLQLSREKGFELLFVQLPGHLESWQRADMNGNFKYLDELGIKYIDLNFHVEEMGYDYVDDMSDAFHPKTTGAYKISEYLCKYLNNNFSLEDKRGRAGYELFDKAVEVSNHEKLSRQLADCDDLAQMFELIGNGEGLVYSITLRGGTAGVAEETSSILKEYVKGRDLWISGGTAVFNDGLVTEILGEKAYSAKLNESEYLYVKPLRNGDEHWDEVHYGSYFGNFESGNFIIVYDTVLDKLVVSRELF